MQSFRDSDSFPSLGSLLRFLTQVLYVPSADAQRNRMGKGTSSFTEKLENV